MNCKHCQTETTNAKYCSQQCQFDAQTKQKVQDFLDGKFIGQHMSFRCWAADLIRALFGDKCNSCGIGSEYNGKPLKLQVNHIDGVATNNCKENVELLCPNCHSQTPNWGARNKNSTRSWRRK